MEYKFRLRDIESKEIFGYEWIDHNIWNYVELKSPDLIHLSPYEFSAIRELFTGYRDKSNNPIYSGDIIKDITTGKNFLIESYYVNGLDTTRYQIIGNKYDSL